MPITKLNTYEGVPIGKENFEEYTQYLNGLVARSNPFIETTIEDLNEVIVLGSDQTSSLYVNNIDTNGFTIETVGGSSAKFFSYRVRDAQQSTIFTENKEVTGSDIITIDTGVEEYVPGDYLVRVEVNAEEGSDREGSITVTVDGSDYAVYFISASTILSSTSNTFYFPVNVSFTDSVIEIIYNEDSGSLGKFLVSSFVYRYENWQYDVPHVINYYMFGPVFMSGLNSRVNVYYGNENDLLNYLNDVALATDVNINVPFPTGLSLIDSVTISANNDTLNSLLFRPNSSDASGALMFVPESVNDSEFSIPVTVDVFKLSNNNLVSLTGTGRNSFAFISNDDKELFSVRTNSLKSSDTQTPGIRKWEIPFANVTELFFSPGNIGYGFNKELLPEIYSKFSGNLEDYNSSKTNRFRGSYEKGFVLATLNGIPQVEDDHIGIDGFFDDDKLQSSDIYQLKSLRLGSEYPAPRYTKKENHQYARQVIEGFPGINKSFTLSSIAGEPLGSEQFNNTLFFPFTDFLLNPSLLLIHRNPQGAERYYYIPKDEDFSPTNEVRQNHYKVIDPASGEIKFNFNLNIPSGAGNKFWIVSAEQLTESTTNNVTDYFSKYGRLYAPTANIDIITKILAFDPVTLTDTDFEFNLPEISLIPSTRIISSSGGPIISDAEEEFSRFVLYGLSYPGQILADEFVRLQANKFEPDVFAYYYYCGTTGFEILSSEKPKPTYIKLTRNDVSWYNRGINRVTYDPVSRAVLSELCIVGNTDQRPENSVDLASLKRRSTLSSLAGTINPADTSFMTGSPRSNSFIFGNSNFQIDSADAPKGSILLGSGNFPPAVLNAPSITGDAQVLTVKPDFTVSWDRPRNPSITTITSGATSVLTTDENILNIEGAVNQVDVFLSNDVQPSNVTTGILISLSSDLQVNDLSVLGNVNLPVTGVNSGVYGNSSNIPQITVGSDGRIEAASNIFVDTNSWKFIKDSSDVTITAGITDTLNVTGVANQTVLSVKNTDVLEVALSTDVSVIGRSSARVFRATPDAADPSNLDNGDIWNTTTSSFIRLNNVNEEIAFVGRHTHIASDISSGILTTSIGGTGTGSYTDGQILIGNTLGGLTKGLLVETPNRTSIIRENSNIRISVPATSSNDDNQIVARDADGNFSAGTITASLSGNATTATTLQTARNINGVSFNGSADITITANTPTSITAGFGLAGGTFNGSAARTFVIATDSVVTTAGTQTITGSKTFSGLIIGNISGNAATVTNGVTTNAVDQVITARKLFSASDTRFSENISINRASNFISINLPSGSFSNSTLTLANGNTILTSGTMVSTTGNQTIGGTKTFSSTIAGSITGNAGTATTLQNARNINGVSFNGSTDITITANTPNTLTRGTYLTGNNFNGSAATTWAVDATPNNTASKVVARDGNGNFSAGTITASLSGNATTATTATTANATAQSVTFNNGGAGAASGTTFNGGTAHTISYNTIGAPSTTGTNASGTWGISINGNSATVTNGVYTTGNQTIGGVKEFSSTITGNITGTSSNVTGIIAIANGGTGASTNTAARTNLGATTVGSSLFTLTNPSAVRFIRINDDNTVTALNAADFRLSIGASPAQTDLAQGTRTTTTVEITNNQGSNPILQSATTSLAGVMSSADKTKLDGIAVGAQVNVATNLSLGVASATSVRIDSSTGTNVVLPVASASDAGIVTTGTQTFAGTKTFNGTLIIPVK